MSLVYRKRHSQNYNVILWYARNYWKSFRRITIDNCARTFFFSRVDLYYTYVTHKRRVHCLLNRYIVPTIHCTVCTIRIIQTHVSSRFYNNLWSYTRARSRYYSCNRYDSPDISAVGSRADQYYSKLQAVVIDDCRP